MNLRISNQLNMARASIAVARSLEFNDAWIGRDPLDFGPDLTQLEAAYAAVIVKNALGNGARDGAADAPAAAKTVLEDAAYVLARALTNHVKKTGRLDRRAIVDVSKSEIVQLRGQALLVRATTIRDLGTAAQAEEGAVGRGVTAARVAALSAALAAYTAVMNHPRGAVLTRGTTLKELETDVAGIVARLDDLDDLVLQFDRTLEGRRFIEAWKRVRITADAGVGYGGPPSAPPESVRQTLQVSRGR